MPGKDGTGPRGGGRGRGMGRGRNRRMSGGMGRGRGNRAGAGPGGDCVCPECGKRVPHEAGIPCYSVNCPKCGANMLRE